MTVLTERSCAVKRGEWMIGSGELERLSEKFPMILFEGTTQAFATSDRVYNGSLA
jgi:hypothetical protein